MSQPLPQDVKQRGEPDPSTRNDVRQYKQSTDPEGLSETHRGAKRTRPPQGPQGEPAP